VRHARFRNGADDPVCARSGCGAAAEPAAPFEEDEQERDRDDFRAHAQDKEITETGLQVVGQPAEVLPEEAGQEAEGLKMVAIMASCFMITFSLLDTMDRCVSMAPPTGSR
jgi:hypothetical protein